MTAHLNTLWFEGELGYLEQLCVLSALAAGHGITIWSYAPDTIRNVPDGVAIADAREVLSDPRRTRLFQTGYKALGSDFFRYELFHQQRGNWIDLDVLVVRPIAFTSPYLLNQAQPQPVFYPLPYDQAEHLFADASIVEGMVKPETVAIHMWNSRLSKYKGSPPPAGSYLAKACKRFGLRT